ncbi:MAG: T9SS type A sorting domain-containing protein [Flavobacteriaceae bacterium]|nr:T9SS type A sorting domain-containing protein [Flavobacteriaceae bacterium]
MKKLFTLLIVLTLSTYLVKAQAPTDSPTAPTALAADVISIYSDAYTDIATNYNPGWGQSGAVDTAFNPGDGNNVLHYSNFNYQGTDVTTTDISAMENLHIDIWVSANVRTVKVTPIATAGAPTEFLVTVPVVAGAWNSVDIPLTDFTGLTLGSIFQMKFDGQFQTDGVTADTAVRSSIYLDNIYFYKAPTASLGDVENSFSIYPNPFENKIHVSGATVVNQVQVFDLTGKQVHISAPNAAKFSLDTSALKGGVYLLSLGSENGKETMKLVK